MTGPIALGIDIGGTSVRAGLVADGHVVARAESATTNDLLAIVAGLAHDLAAGTTIVGIGIGVPEYVHQGRVTSTEVIPWTDAIVGELTAIAPVWVDSDVRCAAVAEWHHLPGESLLYLSWGTGLSTTLVLPDGRPWEGHSGRAIAFGERLVESATLESVASGRGIETHYLARTGNQRTTRELAADAADNLAQTLLRSAGRLTAEALLDATRLLDPARVVIGGGLGTADTEANRTLVAEWQSGGSPAPLHTASHGPDSGLIGAALLALRPTPAG